MNRIKLTSVDNALVLQSLGHCCVVTSTNALGHCVFTSIVTLRSSYHHLEFNLEDVCVPSQFGMLMLIRSLFWTALEYNPHWVPEVTVMIEILYGAPLLIFTTYIHNLYSQSS